MTGVTGVTAMASQGVQMVLSEQLEQLCPIRIAGGGCAGERGLQRIVVSETCSE
jgi:hypothetical protein